MIILIMIKPYYVCKIVKRAGECTEENISLFDSTVADGDTEGLTGLRKLQKEH